MVKGREMWKGAVELECGVVDQGAMQTSSDMRKGLKPRQNLAARGERKMLEMKDTKYLIFFLLSFNQGGATGRGENAT